MHQAVNHPLTKTFWWHNLTQFGGAMNENVFKLIYLNASVLEWNAQQGFIVLLVGLIALTLTSMFVLPDFLLKFVLMLVTRA